MIFQNRTQAGQMLAQELKKYKKNAIVLALPRGGVPVAAEIARELQAPLDVLVVCKIGAPFSSELAVGAICENSAPLFNQRILAHIGVAPESLDRAVINESKEVSRRVKSYRGERSLPQLSGKTVILVDDGLATGATLAAAVKYLRNKNVAQTVVAVPVGAASTVRAFRSKVDDLVVLEIRHDMASVGQWYEDFSQVSDEEVISHLNFPLPEATAG